MSSGWQVLVACADSESRKAVSEALQGTGFEQVFSNSVQESSGILSRNPILVVFCEETLPGGGFRELLSEADRFGAMVPVVVVSRVGEWDEYLRAIRLGVLDLISPPYGRADIQMLVRRALRSYSERQSRRPIGASRHGRRQGN